MLNKAHVIEITKTCTVAFMKARTPWVNQFEMKDTCFEFVINVSWQGNNAKTKLNLKINLQRLEP